MPSCGIGLGLPYGGTGNDVDALAFINRAGIAGGTVEIPQYSNKNILPKSATPYITGNGGYQLVGSGTIASASVTAPDGSETVGILTATSTTGCWVREAGAGSLFTGLPSATYTLSVYLKANTVSNVRVLVFIASGDRHVDFNLSTGTITGSSSATGTITSVGNGWYRCTVTPSVTGVPSSTHIARLVTSVVGDSVYYWGPQFEVGSSATSYVPSTQSPAQGIDGTITVNPRQQIIDFVKGVKALGLWNNFICWPLRSFQNASTTLTARSLGGLGIYDATIANASAGAAWRTGGLYMNAASSQTLSIETIPFYLYNMGFLINREAISTGGGIRFSQGGGRVPWLSVENIANVSAAQFGGTAGLVSTGTTNSYNEFAYVSAGQTAPTTLSIFVNGTLAINNTSSPVIATSGTQINQLIAAGGGLSGAHTYPIIVGTNLQTGALGTSAFYNLYKSTLGQGLGMK